MSRAIPHEALARAVRGGVRRRGARRRAPSRCTATPRAGATCGCVSTARRRADGGRDAARRGPLRARLGRARRRRASDELPFVNVGALARGARASRCRRSTRRARASDGLLLLEDVGDTTLWAAVERRAGARAAALRARRSTCWSRSRSRARAHPIRRASPSRRRFDGALARAELEHFVEHGIETRHGAPLAAGRARRPPRRRSRRSSAPFDDGPFVLSHRDYMAWNLHVQDGRAAPDRLPGRAARAGRLRPGAAAHRSHDDHAASTPALDDGARRALPRRLRGGRACRSPTASRRATTAARCSTRSR